MRLSIGYPSLDDPRGFLQVGQNRQSKLFSVGEEAAIFPCVMAWAATMAKRAGHDVYWLDGPAMGLTWARQLAALTIWKPDLVMWEVKTPSAIGTYKAARTLQRALPGVTVLLVGDHVTALPQEALERVPGAIVGVGGDYDYALAQITSGSPSPASLRGSVVDVGTRNDLSTLPVIDRELCKWRLYSRMGNYLRLPGTHGYSARDCWWRSGGGCTFCSWTNTYKNYRQLSVDQFMADVESAHSLGAKEYFDDAGTWAPPSAWFNAAVARLRAFNGGVRHRYARISIGCNDRPGARGSDAYRAMADAGFRFVLYGLESANLSTLQRINKGQKAGDMRNACRWASEAGLQPHLTVMFGYPWETKEDAARTVALVRDLFDRGWANSMQATLLMPYPGTALFRQAESSRELLTQDWGRYTMNECILKCPMSHGEVLEKIRECYKAAVTPRYLMRKVLNVRTRDDLRFFWRGFKFWWGHLTDFGRRA